MLTISVKNFGPIAEGSVDLKPLTIFVGPSNTGKSYMATAVHAVMQGFERFSERLWAESPSHHGGLVHRSYPYSWHLPGMDEQSTGSRAFIQWVNPEARDPLASKSLTITDLPIEVRSLIERSTFQTLQFLHGEILDHLNEAFGRASTFVSSWSSQEDFLLTIKRENPLLGMEIQVINEASATPIFDISRAKAPTPGVGLRTGIRPIQEALNWLWDEFVYEMRHSVAEVIAEGLPSKGFYLPAGRSAIARAHKFFSASLVRQHSSLKMREIRFSTMPRIDAELLANLISLERGMYVEKNGDILIPSLNFIESQVLHGQVDLDESAGLPFSDIAYETPAGKFTLDQTSSMVSELAPLILFLKYLVRPGDLLIFEEPESHLHPAAQRQLARGIVRLVNAGVKVLITTHSDIIISQVNNLLALRQASPELIESGGFEPEDFLQPDQVGAYLFRYSQELGGCETVPLEIDPDTGIDEDEFAAVFEAIYDESIALQRDRN